MSDETLRVMVVDDDLKIQSALSLVLENAALEHITLLPEKLEEQLAIFRPTVILLDLSMPTLDGIEALGVLRACAFAGRVIVMSGSDRDLIETARRVGQSYGLRMGAGLVKPFRGRDLIAMVCSDDAARPALGPEGDIARAFASGEFCFHYQPKFDLRTRAPVGFESLVRWQHPQRGLLLPSAFLSLITSSGFKTELARRALKDAVARLEEWHELGLTTGISINVALDDATDPSFLLQLTAAVHTMSPPPSCLTIELLEASAELDLCAAAAALTRVRLLGVGISIDDFGMQSSSLARLQHLPANELKIDRSFISNILKFKQDQIIVRSVLALARDLGLTVVVEGIEDEATLDLLIEMGCVYAQGFLLGKPMAPERATELLQDATRTAGQQRRA